MTRVSATEASRNFSDILNRARYAGETFIVERNGEPVAEIRPAPRRKISGAELTARLRSAPSADEGFQADMAAVMAASRSDRPRDPWA